MKKFALLLLLLTSAIGFATHNRAGEILYTRIEPFTQVVGGVTVPIYTYSITIHTYTDHGPNVADRCADTVYFGDGLQGIAFRINDGVPTCQGCIHCGLIINTDPNYIVKLNTYTITHTYAGAGSYLIRMIDPNRNAGVRNIPNSDQQPFYLESLLLINNFTGANTSPEFHNPPIDRACVYKCFYHDPAAYDVDGDSLSFEITTSRGADGNTVPGYFFPETGGGTYGINAITGILTWCTPQYSDQYNIAFVVKEWRKNTSGVYQIIGSVLRDMQVIVDVCPNNPPQIAAIPDTCVEAGTLVTQNLYITDELLVPNPDNKVTLTGAGGAFTSLTPNATLQNSFNNTPYTAQFLWQTTCNHIREQPYITAFKVEDQGPTISLVNFGSSSIKVVPPSVKNVSATPIGSTMKITWSAASCNPSSNPLIAYKIYRKNDCTPYTHGPCDVSIDPASGFSLIAQTTSGVLFYIDNNGGNGLVVGQNYSYLVVAVYKDGSQSYGSSQVCAKLKRDIPVLLNVDVRSTSNASGSIYVQWSKPLVNVGNLDTIALSGPYQFVLKYRNGKSGSFIPVYTASSPYFLNLDTSYTHLNINTLDSAAYYEVEFTAGPTTVGSSQLASSIFLSAIPADRRISLNWKSSTPWNNYKYRVYRKDPSGTSFALLDSTVNSNYTDTSHVVNRYTYCYKVLGEGQYSDPTIFKPLLNNSQEVCTTAKDLTAPCSPTLNMEADCPLGSVRVTWNDVRKTGCGDDVLKYLLFYKATIDEPYVKVGDTLNNTVLYYNKDSLSFVAGCYAVQAIDSSGNVSPLSVDFCIDNCPLFELPNIFSPNNDDANDFYKAIKVRQIKEIDLTVFDRWGNLVYKTKDPYFKWDGVSLQSKILVSDGTFFYFCDVYEPRLTGLRKLQLKGYLQVVH